MTGHQQNPTTGKNLKGDPAAAVNLEELCRAVGIKRVRVVDPYSLAETEAALRKNWQLTRHRLLFPDVHVLCLNM